MNAIDDFWSYSTAVYADISQACLFLQNRHKLDVNIVLFCCWSGSLGKILSVGALARIQEIVAPLRDNVICPLRKARRHLKDNNSIPNAKTLMQNILKMELEAERSEQILIISTLEKMRVLGDSDKSRRLNETLVNLKFYFDLTEIQMDKATFNVLLGLMIGVFPAISQEIIKKSVYDIFNHPKNNVYR